MTKSEMQSQIDTLTGRVRAAESRVAELEALHRTYYNQPFAIACQRAASEERERIIEVLVNRKWEQTPSAYWGDKVSIETDIRRALSIIDSSQQ